jgi:hypothetical protein
MNRIRARKSAVRRRTSFSANGSGAATDEAPLKAFERRLFQQNQGVANIVRIGVRMSRQNLFDAGRESKRPASSLRRPRCWMALSHVDGRRLPSHMRIVTVAAKHVVAKQRIDLGFHRVIYPDGQQARAFELGS